MKKNNALFKTPSFALALAKSNIAFIKIAIRAFVAFALIATIFAVAAEAQPLKGKVAKAKSGTQAAKVHEGAATQIGPATVTPLAPPAEQAQAVDPAPAPPATTPEPPAPNPASTMSSRISRGTSTAQAHLIYSPLDLLIPQKFGFSAAYLASASQTYEFEYLRGKFTAPAFFKDIGSMTDEKISIMARSYFAKNSFNLSYGVTYFRFKIHLGSKYLDGLTASEQANFNVVDLESLGLNVGIGNRWALTERISFGVDWIEIYQPLLETKAETDFINKTSDDSDRKAVNEALSYIGHFPRVTLAKVSLGATF